MRKYFYILPFVVAMAACDPNADTFATKVDSDNIQEDNQKAIQEGLSFKNVAEVVQNKKSISWVKRRDKSASLALHFDLSNKDTLSVSYSSECWLFYPYTTYNNKIIVYWDNIIDSKYDFDIVKAINKTDKKYIGKPFMILELVNDTTLKVTYPIPNLIKEINSSSKDRTLFPDKFVVSQAFYL